ncbi:MAG: diguanylate cyclase [Candidatus Humimicrobiaceae bacterium]
MKKKLCLVVLSALAVVLLFSGCSIAGAHKDYASRGFINLTDYNLEKGKISLDGAWQFYWNRLINPGNFGSQDFQYVEVPSSWDNYGYPLDGYATYRLIVEGKEDQLYGINLGKISSAYKLWVNGEMLSSKGVVAKNWEDAKSKLGPEVVFFSPENNQMEIVLQVSNYSYYNAGIVESVELGNPNELTRERYIKVSAVLFLAGVIFIMAFYHFILFFYKKKDLSPLFLGIASSLAFMQTIFEGEDFFSLLLTPLSLQTEEKLQTAILMLMLPSILFSLFYVLNKKMSKPIIYFFTFFSVAGVIATIFIPFGAGAPLWVIYGGIIALASLYLFYFLIRETAKKDRNALLLLIGATFLVCTVANDYLIDFNIIGSVKILPLGWTIFLVFNSVIIARKFSDSFNDVEVLSKKLNKSNVDLRRSYNLVEQKVKDRTDELNVAKESLEQANMQLRKDKELLKQLSITDGLTELYNHRHITGLLKREINRSKRYGNIFSILILDIDNFKKVNDKFGHQYGDYVLNKISGIIKGNLRKADFAGRYGGEEFLITMPETRLDAAYTLSERIRRTVEDSEWKNNSHIVTISGGVAEYGGEKYSELFRKVDSLLYKAKRNGKNRIEKESKDQGELW